MPLTGWPNNEFWPVAEFQKPGQPAPFVVSFRRPKSPSTLMPTSPAQRQKTVILSHDNGRRPTIPSPIISSRKVRCTLRSSLLKMFNHDVFSALSLVSGAGFATIDLI